MLFPLGFAWVFENELLTYHRNMIGVYIDFYKKHNYHPTIRKTSIIVGERKIGMWAQARRNNYRANTLTDEIKDLI